MSVEIRETAGEASQTQSRAEAFAGSLVDTLNKGALCLVTSIGHRTGLFETMAKLPPSTSVQIAEAAGLNERYVREWLAAMATGGIVEYDPIGKTYLLPSEHAVSLTREAGPGNLAMLAQYIGALGSVEDEIVRCFKNGGGVPYDKYVPMMHILHEETGTVFESALIDKTLPLVPGLIQKLRRGASVLDLGCGSGHSTNLMAQAFPNSRFTGYDLMPDSIRLAEEEAEAWGLTNVRFAVKDVTNLGETERYDLITAFDAIHDQAQPAKVLKGIHDALKHDGDFLMVDIAASSHLEDNLNHPVGPFLYTVSCMHCMTVSLAYDGAGLGTMWGAQTAEQMLRDAGFSSVVIKQIPDDFQNNYFIVRK